MHDVVLADAAGSGGEVPWWWTLIGVPILGLVIELIRRRKGLDQPVSSAAQEGTAVSGTSSAGAKLELAERYVELLEETKREQAAEIAKQDAEIAELRRRVAWLEDQLRDLVSRIGPSPQPLPRSTGWTPPPAD